MKQELLSLAEQCGGALLGIDTSTAQTSVCFIDPYENNIFEFTSDSQGKPSEPLMEILSTSHIGQFFQHKEHRIAAVLVGVGPGSYTGLRVGIAAAKGICLGTGAPLIAISSAKAWIYSAEQTGFVALQMQARGEDAITCLFYIDEKNGCKEIIPTGLRSHALFLKDLSSKIQLNSSWTLITDKNEDFSSQNILNIPTVLHRPQVRISLSILSEKEKLLSKGKSMLNECVPHYLNNGKDLF